MYLRARPASCPGFSNRGGVQVAGYKQVADRQERWREEYRQPPTKARKLGYYTVAGVHDDRSLRVYDPLYPLPSATSTMSMRHLGSPGGLVRNFCGDYQVSPLEVARSHSFSADALRQVEKLECTKEQWKWVANSTPRKTVQALLGAVLEALHCPHQLGLQDAGPITSQSHEMVRSVAACAASRGLPSEPATEAELAASVQRLINSMPTREQLAALQAADPETKQLLEWYRLGRSRTTQPELPRPWRTEARYLKVVDGVLYFRPVLDPHDDMVDVPVLPSGLRQGALTALHYDPLMCHVPPVGQVPLRAGAQAILLARPVDRLHPAGKEVWPLRPG
jgi:hypothetical protein